MDTQIDRRTKYKRYLKWALFESFAYCLLALVALPRFPHNHELVAIYLLLIPAFFLFNLVCASLIAGRQAERSKS